MLVVAEVLPGRLLVRDGEVVGVAVVLLQLHGRELADIGGRSSDIVWTRTQLEPPAILGQGRSGQRRVTPSRAGTRLALKDIECFLLAHSSKHGELQVTGDVFSPGSSYGRIACDSDPDPS